MLRVVTFLEFFLISLLLISLVISRLQNFIFTILCKAPGRRVEDLQGTIGYIKFN